MTPTARLSPRGGAGPRIARPGASFARTVRRLDDLHVVTYDRRGYHHSRRHAPRALAGRPRRRPRGRRGRRARGRGRPLLRRRRGPGRGGGAPEVIGAVGVYEPPCRGPSGGPGAARRASPTRTRPLRRGLLPPCGGRRGLGPTPGPGPRRSPGRRAGPGGRARRSASEGCTLRLDRARAFPWCSDAAALGLAPPAGHRRAGRARPRGRGHRVPGLRPRRPSLPSRRLRRLRPARRGTRHGRALQAVGDPVQD